MNKELKVVVFSNPKRLQDEAIMIKAMFEAGLEHLHLRKPHYKKAEMAKLIEQIPFKYRNRIVVHSHHILAVNYGLQGVHLTRSDRSKGFNTKMKLKYLKYWRKDLQVTANYHSISNLTLDPLYEYVFYSPVFKSISKKGYKTHHKGKHLVNKLKKVPNVIGLGGVEIDRVKEMYDLGFYGAALLGAVWEADDPVQYFIDFLKEVKDNSKELHPVVKNPDNED